MDAGRDSDGQPGGPESAVSTVSAMPAWLEAAALRLLASPGATDRDGGGSCGPQGRRPALDSLRGAVASQA